MDRVQILTIYDETGPTLNQFYAGMHYSKRKKLKDTWKLLTRIAVAQQDIKRVEVYPVTIDCRVVFGPGKRRYDWENCSVTMKMIQDALCSLGIIDDDNHKYISGGRIWTKRGERSCVQVAIREGSRAMKFD